MFPVILLGGKPPVKTAGCGYPVATMDKSEPYQDYLASCLSTEHLKGTAPTPPAVPFFCLLPDFSVYYMM